MKHPNIGKGQLEALVLAEGERWNAANPRSSLGRIPVNRLFYPIVATEENEDGNDVIPPLPRYRPPKKAKAKKTRRTYR